MYPRYVLPPGLISRVALAALLGRPRGFGADARVALTGLQPPLVVSGGVFLPAMGPCLLTVNHYHRPGFAAWWLALALSSVVSCEVHWVMTSAWTYTDPWGRRVAAPVMRWVLGRMARLYDFTSMPPEAVDVLERAQAVRRVLTRARRLPPPVIGLAPEGRDAPDGSLQWPPSGAGRFIHNLVRLGVRLVPVGAYEAEGRLCLQVGAPYELVLAAGLPPDQRDWQVSEQVMRRIAELLPPRLRGEFV